MPDEIYTKILNDLKDVNYMGSIHPYLNAEPLKDPDIVRKVREARKMFPGNVIFLSTNGDYLTKGMADDLIGAGLTWMGVSVYDSTNADELAQIDGQYKEIVFTSLGDLRMTFFNFAGHSSVPCISPMKSCDWVEQKAYINYKGDVVLCCADFDYDIVFGNVMNDSFDNIYNSDRYNEYREAHKGVRGKEMPLCESCNRIG